MVNIEYIRSFAEVLDIIKHMDNDLISNIPNNVIKFLENNAENSNVNIDYSKNLEDIQLSTKTQAILAILYLNYICSPEEKDRCISILQKNEEESKKNIEEKYKYENIFNSTANFSNMTDEPENDKKLVESKKKSFFKKIIEKIKAFLKIK